MTSRIATLNEGPLHASIKAWYARGSDRQEVPVDGKQIDIVRGDLLIEIQTKNLSALRTKVEHLLRDHPVRLVLPVAQEKHIVRIDDDGQLLGRRRSPIRGTPVHAFDELVGVAALLEHPRLSIDILLTREEEVRRHEPGRAWRRNGWVILERRLIEVISNHLVHGRAGLRGLLPERLPDGFTTRHLGDALSIPPRLARRMAYCLRAAGVIEMTGKQGNARTYRVTR